MSNADETVLTGESVTSPRCLRLDEWEEDGASERRRSESSFKTSQPDDEYFLIDLSSEPELLLDRSRDGDAIIRKLSLVEPHGPTALYDAAIWLLNALSRGTPIRSPQS